MRGVRNSCNKKKGNKIILEQLLIKSCETSEGSCVGSYRVVTVALCTLLL